MEVKNLIKSGIKVNVSDSDPLAPQVAQRKAVSEKPTRKARKKMDPMMVKDKVVSFKVNSYQLETIKSKLTIEHSKIGLLARHFLEEQTTLFDKK